MEEEVKILYKLLNHKIFRDQFPMIRHVAVDQYQNGIDVVFFLPESFISWYQRNRQWWNFEPPTLIQIPILVIAIPMVIGFIVLNTYRQVINGGVILQKGTTGKLKSDFSKIS